MRKLPALLLVFTLSTCSIYFEFKTVIIPEGFGGKYGHGFHIYEFQYHQTYQAYSNECSSEIVRSQYIPHDMLHIFDEWDVAFPAEVVVAIAVVESRWNPQAVSKMNWNGSYDYGLMQLNSNYLEYFVDKYWDSEEEFDPFNGEHSLRVAARHLEWLLSRTGNVDDAIKAYNVGLTSVRTGRRQTVAERYFNRVMEVVDG